MLFLHNIFLQKILCGKLLLTIIGKKKSNSNNKFKLELMTTCHEDQITKLDST